MSSAWALVIRMAISIVSVKQQFGGGPLKEVHTLRDISRNASGFGANRGRKPSRM